MTDPDDDSPTEQELREAAALARALEGAGSAEPDAPVDALEAAALLRAGSHSLELDPARAEAQLRELRLPPVAKPRRRWAGVAALGISAAAAMLLMTVAAPQHAAPSSSAPLPPAPVELVSAQLESIRHPAAPHPQLDAELHRYRETLYAELERRHGRGR